MPQIRPVSDLRNHFAEISKIVHETSEPVLLTKNGYGDMVVISYNEYERLRYEASVVEKLKEAEIEAATTIHRFTHAEVITSLRKRVGKSEISEHV